MKSCLKDDDNLENRGIDTYARLVENDGNGNNIEFESSPVIKEFHK